MTFTAAQSARDLNVVVVGWNDSTATISAVTDSKGNAYTSAVGPTVQSGLASQSIYYARNIASAAAGANSVTVTFSRAAVSPDIRILEYSGADPNNPVDVKAANSGNSSSSSSGSATTTSPNDLIFGANLVQTTTGGPGSGFTQRLLTSPDGDIAEDQPVAAIGSYSATAPLTSSGPWIMQMVAFRTASGGGGPTLVSIAVTPVNPSISTGNQQQFTATGTYSDGSRQNITNSVTWTSSVPSAATISSSGLATGVATGSTTIQSGFWFDLRNHEPDDHPTGKLHGLSFAGFSQHRSRQSEDINHHHQHISGGFNVVRSAYRQRARPLGTTVRLQPEHDSCSRFGHFDHDHYRRDQHPSGNVSHHRHWQRGGGIQRTATVSLTVTSSSPNLVLPLKASSNHRYLVDQNGTAFLIMGDAPQALVGNLRLR